MQVLGDSSPVSHGSGAAANAAGVRLHAAIHSSPRNAAWVMQIAAPEVVAVSCQERGLVRGLSRFSMQLGGVSYHSAAGWAREAPRLQRMVEDLGPSDKVGVVLPR